MLDYEVQIHFENGGSFNFRNKFENSKLAHYWIESKFGDDAYSCLVETDDGRSILVNMVKVLAIVLIPTQQLQQVESNSNPAGE